MRITFALTLLAVTFAAPVTAQTKKHKHSHKSHSHGDAKLDVAVDGKTVSFDLDAPGDVIFGFERRPKNDQDKTKIAEELARLTNSPSEFLILPVDAGCVLATKEIHADQADESAKDKANEHADVNAKYTFNCTSDLAGKKLATGLFKAWPRLKTLKVQILGSKDQKGLTLKADTADLAL
jgi:hypothetical protein